MKDEGSREKGSCLERHIEICGLELRRRNKKVMASRERETGARKVQFDGMGVVVAALALRRTALQRLFFTGDTPCSSLDR